METADITLPDEKPKHLSQKQWAVIKLVVGLGIVGLVLAFSPVSIADFFGILLVPILVFSGLVLGTTLMGQGLMAQLRDAAFWGGVQTTLKDARAAAAKRVDALKADEEKTSQ